MDSGDSTGQFGESRVDRAGWLAEPPPYAEAKASGGKAAATVYPDAEECLTFESAPERFLGLRSSCNGHRRSGDALWVREEPTKVAIVDRDSETRLLLRRILEQSGAYRCVGCYSTGEEALQGIPDVHPRIVLMDVRMPGISGIECMRRLKGRMPGLIVVLVSDLTDAETMAEALAAGGDGYLMKPFAVAQCLATIRFSVRPDRSSPPERGAVDGPSVSRESTRLTEREHEVMGCLAKGLLYKEIADELRLSFSMVHKLQHRIFLKLQVNNRTEAVTKWRDGNGAKTPLHWCQS